MSMNQWPRMPNTSVPAARARTPSNTPAPNTMGTMPISAQSLVRWINMKVREEIAIATTGPELFSMGLCI